MKKALQEKNIVVVLFVLVLIIFSMAQRDSQRIIRQDTSVVESKGSPLLSAAAGQPEEMR